MAKMEGLSFNKVGEYLTIKKTIVIPIGSMEQHSQALPLSTDTLIAESIANKIGESMHWMVGPAINIGYSDTPQPFMKFLGTITYSQETLILVIKIILPLCMFMVLGSFLWLMVMEGIINS